QLGVARPGPLRFGCSFAWNLQPQAASYVQVERDVEKTVLRVVAGRGRACVDRTHDQPGPPGLGPAELGMVRPQADVTLRGGQHDPQLLPTAPVRHLRRSPVERAR